METAVAHAPRYYQTIVFCASKPAADFSESLSVRLPGATDRATAHEKLMAALRHDRSLIGGTLEEVLTPTERLQLTAAMQRGFL